MQNIRPLRTETDYDWALREVATYFEKEPEPGTADADRFDVLAALLEVYEERHWPVEAPDPIEAIRCYMDMAGLKQSDLAHLIGSRSRASELLNRKRALTMEQAYKLHTTWHIPAEVLLKPYDLDAA